MHFCLEIWNLLSIFVYCIFEDKYSFPSSSIHVLYKTPQFDIHHFLAFWMYAQLKYKIAHILHLILGVIIWTATFTARTTRHGRLLVACWFSVGRIQLDYTTCFIAGIFFSPINLYFCWFWHCNLLGNGGGFCDYEECDYMFSSGTLWDSCISSILSLILRQIH